MAPVPMYRSRNERAPQKTSLKHKIGQARRCFAEFLAPLHFLPQGHLRRRFQSMEVCVKRDWHHWLMNLYYVYCIHLGQRRADPLRRSRKFESGNECFLNKSAQTKRSGSFVQIVRGFEHAVRFARHAKRSMEVVCRFLSYAPSKTFVSSEGYLFEQLRRHADRNIA